MRLVRKILYPLLVGLLGAGAAHAASGDDLDSTYGTNPWSGGQRGNGFVIYVDDNDIDNSPAQIVDAGGAFTQMSTDTTLYVTYAGDPGDTALVRISGLYANRGSASNALRRRVESFKVAGGDTVHTDSVFHGFEQVWLDSAMGATLTAGVTGGSALVTVGSGLVENTVAHVLFGEGESPVLQKVSFYHASSSGTIIWHVRIWHDVEGPFDYTAGFDHRCMTMTSADSRQVDCDFGPEGIMLPEKSAVAIWATGSTVDLRGGVLMVGKRRRR